VAFRDARRVAGPVEFVVKDAMKFKMNKVDVTNVARTVLMLKLTQAGAGNVVGSRSPVPDGVRNGQNIFR
jgi:hypothetical protein